jgi:hypothetical protein
MAEVRKRFEKISGGRRRNGEGRVSVARQRFHQRFTKAIWAKRWF